jgi:hypothetical protein
VSVFCLGADECEALWPRYAHHLERLEAHGLMRAVDVRNDLVSASKQLWGWQEGDRILGVAITCITQTPRGPMCELCAAVGTESVTGQIEAIVDEIERWAKALGCTRLRLMGRRGWKRRFKWRETGIVLEKDL